MENETVIRELWQECNALLEQGVTYEDYARELAYLLFLKIADEKSTLSASEITLIPPDYSWRTLLQMHGNQLLSHYRLIIDYLGTQEGLPGMMFRASTKITDPERLERLIQVINRRVWHDT
jgi:type I restriction enzyme M protein